MAAAAAAGAGAGAIVDLQQLLSAAIDLAERSGAIIRSVFHSGDLKATDKGAGAAPKPYLDTTAQQQAQAAEGIVPAAALITPVKKPSAAAAALAASATPQPAPPSPASPAPGLIKAASYAGPGASVPRRAKSKSNADLNDPQTIADIRSQKLICGSLGAAFPGLHIVGEEGLLAVDPSDIVQPNLHLCDALPLASVSTRVDTAPKPPTPAAAAGAGAGTAAFPAELRRVPLRDVVCWIDPLDGTKEFTKGQVEACTVLIGFSVAGRAVAGVVHVPFVKPPRTVWGAVGYGVVGRQHHELERVLSPKSAASASSAAHASGASGAAAGHGTGNGAAAASAAPQSAAPAPARKKSPRDEPEPAAAKAGAGASVDAAAVADERRNKRAKTEHNAAVAATDAAAPLANGAAVAVAAAADGKAAAAAVPPALDTSAAAAAGAGAAGAGVPLTPYSERRWAVTSASHMTQAMQELIAGMRVQRTLNVGGAGNKGLMIIDGRADAYIFPQMGTKRWDTCAVDALIHAIGGRATDAYGDSIAYDPLLPHENRNGFLATLRNHSTFVLDRAVEVVRF